MIQVAQGATAGLSLCGRQPYGKEQRVHSNTSKRQAPTKSRPTQREGAACLACLSAFGRDLLWGLHAEKREEGEVRSWSTLYKNQKAKIKIKQRQGDKVMEKEAKEERKGIDGNNKTRGSS